MALYKYVGEVVGWHCVKMELDLNEGVYPNLFLLKMIGHWPVGNEKIYAVYWHVVMSNMYLYNFTQVMYLFKNLDNTQEVTATIYNLLSTVSVVIKANFLHSNFKHFKTVLETFTIPEFQPRNEEQKKILLDGIFWAKFIFFYFVITASFTLVMWLIFPILDKETRLPSNAWFPYDYLSPEYYTATYLWQSVGIIYHATNNVAMDTIFAMLMVQIRAQCIVLNHEVSHLGYDNSAALKDLHRCVEKYNLVLRLSDTVALTFRNVVFVQFMTSVLVLCETMFLMSLIPTFNATFVMLLFFQQAIFTEIFLYCWFGNEVVLKSEDLHYSAFKSNWYECSPAFKKDLLLFMMIIRKPIVLYVGNIFPITLFTFTNILRSSWAYFMALRKVHEKD